MGAIADMHLPHLVVVLLGEGRDQKLGDQRIPTVGLIWSRLHGPVLIHGIIPFLDALRWPTALVLAEAQEAGLPVGIGEFRREVGLVHGRQDRGLHIVLARFGRASLTPPVLPGFVGAPCHSPVVCAIAKHCEAMLFTALRRGTLFGQAARGRAAGDEERQSREHSAHVSREG